MAIMRQTPKCILCGKPTAKAIYRDESKLPPRQRLIGDTFVRWEEIKHECEGKSLIEKSVLNIQNVSDLVCFYAPCLEQYKGKCLHSGRYKECINKQTER